MTAVGEKVIVDLTRLKATAGGRLGNMNDRISAQVGAIEGGSAPRACEVIVGVGQPGAGAVLRISESDIVSERFDTLSQEVLAALPDGGLIGSPRQQACQIAEALGRAGLIAVIDGDVDEPRSWAFPHDDEHVASLLRQAAASAKDGGLVPVIVDGVEPGKPTIVWAVVEVVLTEVVDASEQVPQ